MTCCLNATTAKIPSPLTPNLPNDAEIKELKVLFFHTSKQVLLTTNVMNECRRFPTLQPTPECPYPGYCPEIVQLLARRMRVRLRPLVLTDPDQRPLSANQNSTSHSDFWSELIALVDNGTVDTWCAFLQQTAGRVERFSFTIPLFHVRSGFAVRRWSGDGLMTRAWALFRPYSPTTWVVICLAVAVMLLVGLVISTVEKRMGFRLHNSTHVQGPSTTEVVWQMLRMQLRQASDTSPLFRTLAGKLAMTVFGLLQCLLLLSMYQTGIVYSLVVRPRPTAAFESLDELLRRLDTGEETLVRRWGQAHLMMQSWFFEEVNTSHSWPYLQLDALSPTTRPWRWNATMS